MYVDLSDWFTLCRVNPQWLSHCSEAENWVSAQAIKLGASWVPVWHWKPEEFQESYWYSSHVRSPKNLIEGISTGRTQQLELGSRTRAFLVPSPLVFLFHSSLFDMALPAFWADVLTSTKTIKTLQRRHASSSTWSKHPPLEIPFPQGISGCVTLTIQGTHHQTLCQCTVILYLRGE